MRRFAWALLAGLLACGFPVLGGCRDRGAEPVSVAVPQKRIAFWHIQTSSATRQVVEDAVGRFEGEHKDVAVVTAAFKNDPFKQKLSQATASGKAPDVFHTWGGGVLKSFVSKKQVTDLTSAVEADNLTRRILPAALEFGTIDGKIYAVPTDVAVVVMWYNREMFRKHGVRVPQTFEELTSACVKLRRAGVVPIALGNKDKWPGAFYFIYLATRIGGAKPFADAAGRTPGGTFEHPAFVAAGRKLQQLVGLRAFNQGVNVLAYDEARELFVNEKAAMMLMGTWILADLKSDAPQLLDKLGCFAFPAVTGGRGKPDVIVGGINAAYAVSSRCRFPQDAFGLLKELVSDTTATKWAKTGRIPALRAEVASGMLEEHTLKAARLLYGASEIQLYYDQYLPPKLGELHKSTTQSLIAGTMTPEAAAGRMEALAAKIAARSGAGAAK